MKTDSKRKCKFENNANMRISVDPGIATWLGNVFGCSKEDATAILVDITKKKDINNNDICEKRY